MGFEGMRKSLPLLLLAMFLAVPAVMASSPENDSKNRLSAEEMETGWKQIFDGKSLAGWGVLGKPEGWAVEDGTIACTVKGGGMIYSKQRYKDFMLRCQFKVDPRVNSGVFVRWEDLKDPVHSGMEVQILDSFGRLKPDIHDCGALYDIMPPSMDVVRPAGEWNDLEITCRGPIVRVVLNSQQVVALDLSTWTTPGQNPDGGKNKFKRAYNTMVKEGHFGLQDHGGRVWYRNLRVKSLPEWAPPVRG